MIIYLIFKRLFKIPKLIVVINKKYTSSESKIVVKGRYVGSIALTTSRVYSEEKTNVAQVWTIIDNLPWLQIIESFLTTVVVFVLVLAILLKTKNNKKVILLIVGAIILLIAVAFIYSNRMI